MLCANLSPVIWEVASGTFNWPATTKSWVVATLLMEGGTRDAHMLTYCCETALDFASALATTDGTTVSLLCANPDSESWHVRQVAEAFIGTLGNAVVAVFRDSQGNEFCPDAPQVPASQISDRVSVCNVQHQLQVQKHQGPPTDGKTLHAAISASLKDRRAPATPSTATQEPVAAEASR